MWILWLVIAHISSTTEAALFLIRTEFAFFQHDCFPFVVRRECGTGFWIGWRLGTFLSTGLSIRRRRFVWSLVLRAFWVGVGLGTVFSVVPHHCVALDLDCNTLRAASEQFVRLQHHVTLYLRTGSFFQVLSPTCVWTPCSAYTNCDSYVSSFTSLPFKYVARLLFAHTMYLYLLGSN